jgi:hypothetical protein
MSQVGFELTIPVFMLAKTVHVLDLAGTVIGETKDCTHKIRTIFALMIIIFWEMTPCGSYKNQEPISQKMIIIIVTAVETSNLTIFAFF